MAQPSKPTPERAAQGEAKKIPIDDARPAAGEDRPQAPTADTGGSAQPPSPYAALASQSKPGDRSS